jgi:hypothetical protein
MTTLVRVLFDRQVFNDQHAHKGSTWGSDSV